MKDKTKKDKVEKAKPTVPVQNLVCAKLAKFLIN